MAVEPERHVFSILENPEAEPNIAHGFPLVMTPVSTKEVDCKHAPEWPPVLFAAPLVAVIATPEAEAQETPAAPKHRNTSPMLLGPEAEIRGLVLLVHQAAASRF
jgi:hypothetical protein